MNGMRLLYHPSLNIVVLLAGMLAGCSGSGTLDMIEHAPVERRLNSLGVAHSEVVFDDGSISLDVEVCRRIKVQFKKSAASATTSPLKGPAILTLSTKAIGEWGKVSQIDFFDNSSCSSPKLSSIELPAGTSEKILHVKLVPEHRLTPEFGVSILPELSSPDRLPLLRPSLETYSRSDISFPKVSGVRQWFRSVATFDDGSILGVGSAVTGGPNCSSESTDSVQSDQLNKCYGLIGKLNSSATADTTFGSGGRVTVALQTPVTGQPTEVGSYLTGVSLVTSSSGETTTQAIYGVGAVKRVSGSVNYHELLFVRTNTNGSSIERATLNFKPDGTVVNATSSPSSQNLHEIPVTLANVGSKLFVAGRIAQGPFVDNSTTSRNYSAFVACFSIQTSAPLELIPCADFNSGKAKIFALPGYSYVSVKKAKFGFVRTEDASALSIPTMILAGSCKASLSSAAVFPCVAKMNLESADVSGVVLDQVAPFKFDSSTNPSPLAWGDAMELANKGEFIESIYFGVNVIVSGASDIVLARLSKDLALDTSFGSQGILQIPLPGSQWVHALAPMNGALILGGDDTNVPVPGPSPGSPPDPTSRGFLIKILQDGTIDTAALKLNSPQLSAYRGGFYHAVPGYFRTKDDTTNIRHLVSTSHCTLSVLLHDYRFTGCLPLGEVDKRPEPVVGSNFLKPYLNEVTSSNYEDVARSSSTGVLRQSADEIEE
jgi:hypothetical protein